MSERPRVWVLNLDAEHELEARNRYQPTQHLRAIVARERRRLIGTLVAPGDIVLDEHEIADARRDGRDTDTSQSSSALRERPDELAPGLTCSPSGLRERRDEIAHATERDATLRERIASERLTGIAWCPTPRAIARLSAAGATPLLAPHVDVLRSVNARPFAALVRAPFARESFDKDVAHTLEHALELIARPAADGWLVRRTFGAAGRGRRRIRAGTPNSGELAWLVASLRLGPLVVEPWVRVTREYTRSAWVHPSGEVSISAPCFQETTEHGAWVRTERAPRGDVSREDDARLAEVVEAAGRALAQAGYFGPYGLDAYRHRVDGRAGDVLNPLSEINARFTMDWAGAMSSDPATGAVRDEIERFASASVRT
jgi:hypothetical protein